jgi:hypothetical protein
MPLIPDPPFPKAQGDNIRSKDWNDLADEVVRLGSLPLGIGTNTPDETVTVQADQPALKLTRPDGQELVAGVREPGNAFLGSITKDLALFTDGVTVTLKKDGFVGINVPEPTVPLDVAGRARVQGLDVRGDLVMPKTAGADASFTTVQLSNENNFSPNLKLNMDTRRFLLPGTGTYQFMIGHTVSSGFLGQNPVFVPRLTVNQDGNAVFGAGKGGYVVDFFVNAVGDALEQGDVVVLNTTEPVGYYGAHDAIPVPEVDLTDQAYDTRVCGIVADFVRATELPTVDPRPDDPDPGTHPFARYGAAAEGERTMVGDQQMGRMVTLGAYAHCKVDADIAPVVAGDLLTTSPTRGHAQKVVDRGQALGAVLGKALGPLAGGRGTIPILVTLH